MAKTSKKGENMKIEKIINNFAKKLRMVGRLYKDIAYKMSDTVLDIEFTRADITSILKTKILIKKVLTNTDIQKTIELIIKIYKHYKDEINNDPEIIEEAKEIMK